MRCVHSLRSPRPGCLRLFVARGDSGRSSEREGFPRRTHQLRSHFFNFTRCTHNHDKPPPSPTRPKYIFFCRAHLVAPRSSVHVPSPCIIYVPANRHRVDLTVVKQRSCQANGVSCPHHKFYCPTETPAGLFCHVKKVRARHETIVWFESRFE